MSLILGAWMVSANTYQRLVLNLNQQETKRAEIRRQIDSHELETYFKAVAQHEAGSLKDELARMSGRTHALRSTSKPPAKGKR
jgi:hypothetical protein